MGFDILALHPIDKDSYFSNDIWSWYPLWDFVCEVTGDLLTDKQKEMGCTNDGFKYNAKISKAIAKILKEALDSGAVKKYERKHRNNEDTEEVFSEKNVRDFQHFCKRCNGFEIC